MMEQDIKSKPAVIEVEIDGEVKQFTAEDVKNLKAMQKSATEKYQKASPVLKLAESLGFERPEEFGEHASFAMERFHQLMQDGIIDAQGNPLTKQDKGNQSTNQDFMGEFNKPNVDIESLVSSVSEKALGRINETLSKSIKPVYDRIDKIERLQIAKAIKDRHPNLSNKELSEIFVRASKDGNKSILEHSDDVNSESLSALSTIEKEFAKKYGIDIDAYNKRKEMPPDGGASAILASKKPKFKSPARKWGPNDKDPDAVDPKEAMKEFFRNMNSQ